MIKILKISTLLITLLSVMHIKSNAGIQSMVNVHHNLQRLCDGKCLGISNEALVSFQNLINATPNTRLEDFVSKKTNQFLNHLENDSLNKYGMAALSLLLLQEALKQSHVRVSSHLQVVVHVARQFAALLAISHTIHTFVLQK